MLVVYIGRIHPHIQIASNELVGIQLLCVKGAEEAQLINVYNLARRPSLYLESLNHIFQ